MSVCKDENPYYMLVDAIHGKGKSRVINALGFAGMNDWKGFVIGALGMAAVKDHLL